MTAPIDYYYRGYQDALKNLPKAKGLKRANLAAYEAGYREGHKDRSQSKTA